VHRECNKGIKTCSVCEYKYVAGEIKNYVEEEEVSADVVVVDMPELKKLDDEESETSVLDDKTLGEEDDIAISKILDKEDEFSKYMKNLVYYFRSVDNLIAQNRQRNLTLHLLLLIHLNQRIPRSANKRQHNPHAIRQIHSQ
jgi:hypothetical protein